jgi:biopolymer transport protein ExbD
MGHDHQQSSSSGALVALVGVVLIVAILGVLVVAGAGLFFVQASRVQVQRAMVARERAVAETHRAEAEAIQAVVQEQRAEATPQIQESSVGAIPDPRLNFEVNLDREGNASVDGEKISLDNLRARLAKLKGETGNSFYVLINADSECPAKHIIPVLDVCEEVGDIDFSIEVAAVGWASDAEPR